MRPTLPALLLFLAACGTQPQAQTAQPSVTTDNRAAGTGCGAPLHNGSSNEAEMASMCGPEMTPSDWREVEARARGGNWEAMLILAREAGSPAEAHRWYEAAIARGRCPAVRLLLATMYQDGQSDAEHRRWAAEDRRLACSVDRWTANADGSLVYAMPDDFGWGMWIGCVAGRVRITGVSGSVPNRTQLIFRTARGVQPRTVSRADVSGRLVLAFDAEPDDEVLAALLRGERIEMRYGPPYDADVIDAHGAQKRLRGLVQRCFGRG